MFDRLVTTRFGPGAIALWALAVPMPAQAVIAPHSNGPLVGIPALFSASETTTLTSPDRGAEGYYKPPFFQGTPPVPLDGSTSVVAPDFSAKALLRDPAGCGIPGASPVPEIDAVSLGVDWITVKAGGIVEVPFGHWSGIVFSVRAGTKGTKGQILGETTRTDSAAGASADVFSYIFKGSEMVIPASFVDVTHRANDAGELSVPGSGEMDGMDVYAALYRLPMPSLLGLPTYPTVYFSVTTATTGRVPLSWWSGKPVSGATIFSTTWDGSKWSCPTGTYAPADLGLADGEEIDALALDLVQKKALISTRTASRDPVLYVDLSGNLVAAAVTLVYADNKKVSDGIGIDYLLVGDVDAICAVDPGGRVQLQRAMGILTQQNLLPNVPRIESQCFIDPVPTNPNQRILKMGMAGGHANGWGVPIVMPAGNYLNMVLFAPIPVPPTSPFQGRPVNLGLTIPPRVQPGLTLDLFWLGIDPTLLQLQISLPPFRITL